MDHPRDETFVVTQVAADHTDQVDSDKRVQQRIAARREVALPVDGYPPAA